MASWRATQTAAVAAWLDIHEFRGERHRVLLLPRPDGAVAGVVLGLGALPAIEALSPWTLAGLPEKLPPGSYRFARDLPPVTADHAVLGWLLGSLPPPPLRNGSKVGRGVPRRARLCPPSSCDLDAVTREALALGWARDLINRPPNLLGPAELAAVAVAMGAGCGARTEVIVGDDLLAADYPMIHAVGRAAGRAAERAPRLIDLRWGDERHPKVTIVGKGVCFDSGGLDIKPGAAMALMKKDMGGAATMLGLAHLIMGAQLPIRLRLLIPAVENAVSGNAFRPGDVLKTRKGLTVEIGNTDAEGRLVLADALSEAAAENPMLLVDCATLTGACRVALGSEVPGVFVTDDGLAADLMNASRITFDPVWRLPLHQPYRKMLDSKVADINNAGEGGFAGAITAALFLKEFVPPNIPWVHVDSYAWNSGERPGRPTGGEALSMRALFEMIQTRIRA
jgi:leucyl aminopeptidase